MKSLETRYLERLAELYPTIGAASTEVINLEAILNLPKGTEHFLTDIHGEYEAFAHVLKNGSGAVKRKVNEVFGNTLSSPLLLELIHQSCVLMVTDGPQTLHLLKQYSRGSSLEYAPGLSKHCFPPCTMLLHV